MIFASAFFLFAFLPLCLLINKLLQRTGSIAAQNLFLLAASLFFYAFGEIYYTLVMIVSIAMNYAFGLLMARFEKQRAPILAVGVIANLALLAYYKYFNFLVDNLNSLTGLIGGPEFANEPVHLPIGISFFTFQAISYLVDIHRGDARVQKNPLYLGLYISLFPQLIAGPIVRYNMVDEEIRKRTVTLQAYVQGVRLFCAGLFYKAVIADTVAKYVDESIATVPVTDMSTGLVWLIMVGYSLQIFFDFAGYSNMALGLGRMFGFTFPVNFNQPYMSTSIREFWRRWHISLSSWFRDYVYIPLGGSRGGPVATYRNLLIVFFITGLWHGASWNFVIWGLWHGAFIVLERMKSTGRYLDAMPFVGQRVYVMLVAIVGWVPFRFETLPDALGVIQRMFWWTPTPETASVLADPRHYLDPWVWTVIVCGIVIAMISPERGRWFADRLGPEGSTMRETGLAVGSLILLVVASAFVASGSYTAFIYFRF